MFRQRVRIFFRKEGLLRFISHHDLMRLFERALRRAGLPLKLSEGFNPRPQVSFPLALALGVESRAEIVEFELTEWVSPRRVREKLERQLPEGIGISSGQSVAYGEKAEVVASEFSVEMGTPPPDFEARLAAFMAAATVMLERSGKSAGKRLNVRSFVRAAHFDGKTLRLDLSVSPAGSVRPDEVIQAVLGRPLDDAAPLRITRTRLDLSPPS